VIVEDDSAADAALAILDAVVEDADGLPIANQRSCVGGNRDAAAGARWCQGFAGWRWSHGRDKAPQGALAAEIAALLDHVENPGRAQSRIFLERLLDEFVVRRK
jgi:hypothetical protein